MLPCGLKQMQQFCNLQSARQLESLKDHERSAPERTRSHEPKAAILMEKACMKDIALLHLKEHAAMWLETSAAILLDTKMQPYGLKDIKK